jgi:hypothetical protein
MPQKWREKTVSGSGGLIRIFDGADLFTMDEGGDEYVRAKRKPKDEELRPSPYALRAEWSKASESGRQSCGIPGHDDRCVTLDAPVGRNYQLSSSGQRVTILGGAAQWFWISKTVC